MLNIFGCIPNDHDPVLACLAVGVCVLGLRAMFILQTRSEECIERRRRIWASIAAVAAGISIWATQFLTMLACPGPLPLGFDLSLTLCSIGVPIIGIRGALSLLRPRPSVAMLLLAGALVTTTVAVMNFVGMEALIVPARIYYSPGGVAQAFVGAMLLLSLSLAAHWRLRGWPRAALPVLTGTLGIATLHLGFTAAITLVPGGGRLDTSLRPLQPATIAYGVVLAIALVITSMLAAALLDRVLTDLRGLAQATREGIAILQNGRIVEANDRLAMMLDIDPGPLIGSRPEDWLVTIDGDALALADGQLFDARPRVAGDVDRCLEVACHAIEYRGRRARVMAVRDLTEQRRAQSRIEFLAVHDPLTQLPNRSYMQQALEAAIDQADQKGSLALLALDLDRFKAVNDLFGHEAGDDILCRVAEILNRAVAEAGLVARIGGDEFLILQHGVGDPEQTRRLVDTILAGFATEMDLSRDPMAVGVSIGISFFPQDAADASTLRHNADVALYRAKANGRGMASFFDHEMDRAVKSRRLIEHDLRHALLRDQMRLVYQPLVATGSTDIIGYEALLRWQHPDHGEIGPSDFVPIAEDTGIILQLGEWVLFQACRTAATWPDPMTLAVNVSPIQFQLPNLVEIVTRAVRSSGFPAHRLELEITEGVLLHHRERTLNTLHQLKAMGIAIVMDDFGTGYSSLSNLQSFPFDKIKIDRSFISGVTNDESARSIVRAIVGLGHSLNLPVVAEGVETAEQHRMVLEEGCQQSQGFLFGRPDVSPFYDQSLASTLRRRP
ncbi:EAL domain-containing protein [Sphingomonas sp.]|uniref:putative bifunctional diguanylate cyclase/phosphodiesterase n=1 Tax=Sphingomonas sp. TaxID=28214 RepID=UPI0031E24ED5